MGKRIQKMECYFAIEKKEILPFNNINESWRYYVKWGKSVKEEQVWSHFYVKIKTKQTERKTRELTENRVCGDQIG